MDLVGLALEATSGAPLVVLREMEEPHRLLPIVVGGAEAAAIALAVSGEAPPRPLTHDLMASLVRSLDGHLDAVEVTELRDGAYLASLAVHGPGGPQRLDTRPSDAIALAVHLGAPLLVADEVLDEAGTLPPDDIDEEPLDEDTIDEAVDEFRSFLDTIDPSQFAEDADRDGSESPGPAEDGDEDDQPG